MAARLTIFMAAIAGELFVCKATAELGKRDGTGARSNTTAHSVPAEIPGFSQNSGPQMTIPVAHVHSYQNVLTVWRCRFLEVLPPPFQKCFHSD